MDGSFPIRFREVTRQLPAKGLHDATSDDAYSFASARDALRLAAHLTLIVMTLVKVRLDPAA